MKCQPPSNRSHFIQLYICLLACVMGRNVLGFPVGVISNNQEVPKIPRMLIDIFFCEVLLFFCEVLVKSWAQFGRDPAMFLQTFLQ